MKKLKRVLITNAISSGSTGAIMALMPGKIASLFEVAQSTPFLIIGIFLVLFAIQVSYVALKGEITVGQVKPIILMDLGWVIASFVIVLFSLFNFSMIGYVLTTLIALWVGTMAFLQNQGVKRLERTT